MSTTLDLVMGTQKARALQDAIQDELAKRGFSAEGDGVMAEYITIMLINAKTPAQITSELEDLIGADYDASFTDWLFIEAAKPSPSDPTSIPTAATPPVATRLPLPVPQPIPSLSTRRDRDDASHNMNQSRQRPPRNPLFQHALSATVPPAPSAQKRTASMRSPSPSSSGQPSKVRRTDLPDRPRAMRDEHGNSLPPQQQNQRPVRSLLERVGGPHTPNGFVPHHPMAPVDAIQAQIDAVTRGGMSEEMGMLPHGPMPPGPMPGMFMGGPPMGMQDVVAAQMMLMQQMHQMQLMISNTAPTSMNNGFPPPPGGHAGGMQGGRGGGGGRGVRGRGGPGARGHTGPNAPPDALSVPGQSSPANNGNVASESIIHAPSPLPAANAPQILNRTPNQPQPPARPQSPTLCKFASKCTNAHCRFSHPSPVATPESGVVLSNEPCKLGLECKDADCIYGHPSAAVTKGLTATHAPPETASQTPCKFGNACTRPNCAFVHPRDGNAYSSKACRFGAACTRADCTFTHPPGRVLPGTFHRGLTKVMALSNGASSPHKSMTFKPDPNAQPFVPSKPTLDTTADSAITPGQHGVVGSDVVSRDDKKAMEVAATV